MTLGHQEIKKSRIKKTIDIDVIPGEQRIKKIIEIDRIPRLSKFKKIIEMENWESLVKVEERIHKKRGKEINAIEMWPKEVLLKIKDTPVYTKEGNNRNSSWLNQQTSHVNKYHHSSREHEYQITVTK